MGSFRHDGCYDFVRTDQRGWDLLDIMDVTTFQALTRRGGIFLTSWFFWLLFCRSLVPESLDFYLLNHPLFLLNRLVIFLESRLFLVESRGFIAESGVFIC